MQKFKIKKSISKKLISFLKNKQFILFFFALSLVSSALALDPSSDILSSAKQDIDSNFGSGSTVMYIVYIIEIFSGIAAYIKTKNLFSLLGLVVVVIFTTVVFGII